MTEILRYLPLKAEEQGMYHVHPKYNLYAANALGSVINIATKKAIGVTTPAWILISVKGDNAEITEMFRKDFIYTLFCGDIPEGQRVYRANGAVADDNIENLGLQNEFKRHPIFDLYEANDKGIIRHRKTKNVIGNLGKDGYLRVTVRGANTNQIHYQSHRFIYETFHGVISNNLVIDHINKIKADNCLENLDLVTQQENVIRGGGSDGSNFKNPKSIISINLETGEKIKFKSIYSAAKYHEIDPSRVNFVADGKAKSATSMVTFDSFNFKYDNQ